MENILNKFNSLNLKNIKIQAITDHDSHYVLEINGGLNGSGNWKMYLTQLQSIVDAFEEAYIIDLSYDCIDDIWYLTLGISK